MKNYWLDKKPLGIIDIITVNRSKSYAYVYTGCQRPDGCWDGTNKVLDLGEIEDHLGYQLPDGEQNPWIRMPWVKIKEIW